MNSERAVIVYDVQIDPTVSPGTSDENAGTLFNYSNEEGGDDFTGSGDSGTEGDLEDGAEINVSDPATTKTITDTSDDRTEKDQFDGTLTDLIVGEEVTFEIVVTLPEGESHPVTVTDNLPNPNSTPENGALSVVSSCIKSIGANLSLDGGGSLPTERCPDSFGAHNDRNTDGILDQIVFDFGDVNNTVDGVENDNDRIYLQVVAKVEAHADNEDGDQLVNEVEITAGSQTTTGERDFEILQPDLDLEDAKTDHVGYFSPGGLLVYEIDYANNGNGPATGVVITETVSTGTTFNQADSDSGWHRQGTTDACEDGDPAGTVCDYEVGNMDAGDSGSVKFAVEVNDPLDASITEIENEVSIDDAFDTDDADSSNDSDTDTDMRAYFSKQILSTNQTFTEDEDVAIGEILTYQLYFRIPPPSSAPGEIPNLVISDELEKGLAFADCVSVTASANLETDLTTTGDFETDEVCSPDPDNPTTGNPAVYPIPQTGDGSTDDVNQGRRVVFDLGNVTTTNSGGSDDHIIIEYQVVVLDSAENLRDLQLNDLATVEWKKNDTENQIQDNASDVTLVEPFYSLSKRGDRVYARPGTIITFTLYVAHTPESNADAFEVILTDHIPRGLNYVSGTLAVASGLPADDIDDSNPRELHVTWDGFPLGDVATVTYQASLGNIPIDTGVSNTANLEWTSLPGDFINAPNAPQSEYNLLSIERWYDPASNVDIYGVSDSWTIVFPRPDSKAGRRLDKLEFGLPGTGFPPGQVTILPPRPQGSQLEDFANMTLELPSLGVRVPIVGIPYGEEGWDLTWLSTQAGYLDTTAYPTWEGNTVLTAHAYLADGLPGPFVDLASLKWGDHVVLYAHGQRYTYEVRDSKLVSPRGTSILEHKDRDWLTLFTCYQYDEASDQYLWRHVVQAVLVDVELLE